MCFYVSKIHFRHLSMLILGLSHFFFILKIPFWNIPYLTRSLLMDHYCIKNNLPDLCVYNFTCMSRTIELHLLD